VEKTNETKQKLLKAACTVFREKTYEKAKVSDIVAHAEVAQGTFYLYFKSKKDCLNMLILEMIYKFMQDMEKEFLNLNEESVYQVIEKILNSFDFHSSILAIMHFEQLNMDEKVSAMHNRVYEETNELLKKLLIHRGVSRESADIKIRMIDALLKQYLLSNVYVFSNIFHYDKEETLKMMKVVIEGVDC
jgi:AcrR family transcriptional regulator